MKYYTIIFGLILLFAKASNGQDTSEFFFDEFHISLNRNNLHDNNTEDWFGFGVYRSFRSDKDLK